jgi:hypothetical protein
MSVSSRRTPEDPAQQAARLLSRLGVFILFVVAQIAPVLARQTVYILLPIGAALLLLAASLSAPEQDRRGEIVRSVAVSPLLLGVVFLLAWAGLSLVWTPFSNGPGERFAKNSGTLALVVLACAFLPPRTKTSNLNLLPIGAGLAAVLLAGVALYTRHPLTPLEIVEVGGLQRAGLGLALLMWPAMGALAVRDRWYSAALLGAASALACFLSQAPNALPGLVAGAVVFALCFGRSRTMAPKLAVLAAATVFAAPLVALAAHLAFQNHAPLALRPLDVWGHILMNDGLRALAGHGFGAALLGVFRGYLDPGTPLGLLFRIWFDLGIFGAAALALVSARAILVAGRCRPSLAPFLIAGVAAGFVMSILGPAAEQLWWLTLIGFDVIAYALVMRGQFRKRRPRVPLSFALSRVESAPEKI